MFRTRSIVAISSAVLVVLAVAGWGWEIGWLLLALPSVALLPVFAVAALTRSYGRAVAAMIGVQVIAIFVIAFVALLAWPFAIPQLISSVLGIVALRSKRGDEVRVAGSIPAACIIPALCTWWMDRTALVLVVALGVAGCLWYRDARRRASNERLGLLDSADLELPRAVALSA